MSRRVRLALSFAGLAVIAVTVTACTMSVSGGVLGSLGAALFAAGLLFGTTSQAGCDTSPCLSPVPPDASIEPDSMGPCLGMPLPDGGLVPDSGIGPDAGADLDAGQSVAPSRAEAIDRLRDRLPADVLDRLTTPETDE
jgi:hypothetical protein